MSKCSVQCKCHNLVLDMTMLDLSELPPRFINLFMQIKISRVHLLAVLGVEVELIMPLNIRVLER
jgi:hypothetical protein